MDWHMQTGWEVLRRREDRVSLEKDGICINGTYHILLVSSLFYFRIPAPKWDERMKELKSAGYNAVDVYFPWNYHETVPGEWDFAGDKDVERFLELAKENELWVIARPGPYICSEWDGGAIPAWHSLNQFSIRQDDDAYILELSRWYAKILPVIYRQQWSNGGAVILLQVENELDYFLCGRPTEYVGRLAQIARECDIDVPMFICCGQDDIERSGGDAPGVKIAFNVYDESDSKGLEERVSRLSKEMYRRGQPLLVMETNREHAWLKRVLGCGAKMIAPYNQTAGTTMDYYNAVTNWGKNGTPLALLSSDYDFCSMIGADGTLRKEEYIQARLLSGLLLSFGEDMARVWEPGRTDEQGVYVIPEEEDGAFCQAMRMGNEDTAFCRILHTGKGKFCIVRNLGQTGQEKVLRIGGEECSVFVPPFYTAMIPVDIRLSPSVRLEWANYEIAWIRQEEGKCLVALYGQGILRMRVLTEGRRVAVEESVSEKEVGILEIGECTFLYGRPKTLARRDIPGLAPWCLEERNSYIQAEVKSARWIPWNYEEAVEDTAVMEMERLSQYRGRGSYEFELEHAQKVQIAGLADIVTIFHNGCFWRCFYGDARERTMELPKGKWQFRTEIWGHCNFEDIRVESLRLGSLKGMRGIWQVIHEQDISDNWEYGESRGVYRLYTNIDQYNIPCSPMVGFYRKKVRLWKSGSRFTLFFRKAACSIRVWINGEDAGEVKESNPCVDITAFMEGKKECIIELEVCRRYYSDPVGKITLTVGEEIGRCRYRDITFRGTDAPMELETAFPVPVSVEEEIVIAPRIPDQGSGDIRLYLKGKNLLVTVVCGGHVAGRLLLLCKNMPQIAGGSPDSLFLCKEWLQDGRVVMKCQALDKDACLEEICVRTFGLFKR